MFSNVFPIIYLLNDTSSTGSLGGGHYGTDLLWYIPIMVQTHNGTKQLWYRAVMVLWQKPGY